MSDEVENIFRESEAKPSKLFKSKFGRRNLLSKLFRSWIKLENECFEDLKMVFLSFCKVLSEEVETVFRESVVKC